MNVNMLGLIYLFIFCYKFPIKLILLSLVCIRCWIITLIQHKTMGRQKELYNFNVLTIDNKFDSNW